jgi:hypothetical protein
MPQQSRHHKTRLGCRLNAGVALWVERHGCRESAVRTGMSVRRGPTERRRSEGTSTKSRPNREPGHELSPRLDWVSNFRGSVQTLGYLVSFQVTRRRRNSLDVRTNQTISVTPNSGNAYHTSEPALGRIRTSVDSPSLNIHGMHRPSTAPHCAQTEAPGRHRCDRHGAGCWQT